MSRPLLHILMLLQITFRPWLILSHYCLSLCPYFINMYIGMRRSRNICQGIQAKPPENSSDNDSFSPQLILQFYSGCPMVISKKTIIFQGFRGVSNIFQGGGPFLLGGGGFQMLISIETDITSDFPRGSGPPIPTSGSAHYWIRIG